jgi:hypothetical protein
MLSVGMDGHKESMAVAYVARAHDAHVMYRSWRLNPEVEALQALRGGR